MPIRVIFGYNIKIFDIMRYSSWDLNRDLLGDCAFAPCTCIWHYTVCQTAHGHLRKVKEEIVFIGNVGIGQQMGGMRTDANVPPICVQEYPACR